MFPAAPRPLSHREQFTSAWAARKICPDCAKPARPLEWYCECGGELRALTADEIETRWKADQTKALPAKAT